MLHWCTCPSKNSKDKIQIVESAKTSALIDHYIDYMHSTLQQTTKYISTRLAYQPLASVVHVLGYNSTPVQWQYCSSSSPTSDSRQVSHSENLIQFVSQHKIQNKCDFKELQTRNLLPIYQDGTKRHWQQFGCDCQWLLDQPLCGEYVTGKIKINGRQISWISWCTQLRWKT